MGNLTVIISIWNTRYHGIGTATANLIIYIFILVTMVTHNFPPKWFPWQLNHVTCQLSSLKVRIPSIAKIGLTSTTVQSDVLFGNTFSKTVILLYIPVTVILAIGDYAPKCVK